jgi:uncharacterized protein (DUF885 family)
MTKSLVSLDSLADDIFNALAQTFPVACASDEFYYFPQVRSAKPDWSRWDDFSPDVISEIVTKLSIWENDLDAIKTSQTDTDADIDIMILKKLILTLKEHLAIVRQWESQPSFYLALSCLGLAEVLEAEDPDAGQQRAKALPAFLVRACNNLKHVPVLFRDIALEMVASTRSYIAFLKQNLPELGPSLRALEQFQKALCSVSTRDHFLLPDNLFDRAVKYHLSAGMDAKEAEEVLDREIDEMKRVMHEEARYFVPDWPHHNPSYRAFLYALKQIPLPDFRKNGLIGLYQKEVEQIGHHCLEQGLINSEFLHSQQVMVSPVPSYFSAIRASSSYSIPLKHPPSGGTFFILNSDDPEEAQKDYHRDYRMLSAHETYPGHHLLDIFRLSHTRPVRRAFEQPIFYEGWACYAEDLLRETGFFSEPHDRFLLAKRRLWRALRGKVDVGIQTGTLDVQSAASYLSNSGISHASAVATVHKYSLQPGYQLCYTLGVRRFLGFFSRYGQSDIKGFVSTVLKHAEILFPDLENIFRTKKNEK